MKSRRSIVENLLLVTLLGALLFVLHGLESTFAKGPKPANKGTENKITLCYKPGTPTEKTISVSANDLGGHLAHGDLEGPCVLIDAHSQFDIEVEPEKVITLVLQGGISQIILGRRRGRSAEDLLSVASHDRIIPAIKTKGDSYRRNLEVWYDNLERRAESGLYGAMGEVLMWHAEKKSRGAPEVEVHPNDARVQFALDLAIEHGWPLVVHIEFAHLKSFQMKPHLHDQFMEGLEKLLNDNPNHPFAMIHMGQLECGEVEEMLDEHPNIHFMTSHANPIFINQSDQPWVNMFDGERLTEECEELMIEYPDRFILAFDNVGEEHWTQLYLDQIDLWRSAMKWLPADVAEAFAHGNAERLWGLRLPVPLDIKPRRCPNRLKVRRDVRLQVAIPGTADFDVTQIDPASIRLEGVSPVRLAVKDVATRFEPIVGKVSKFHCTREGPDGFDDLNLKFRNKDVVAALGDVSHRDVLVLKLTANLIDGTPIYVKSHRGASMTYRDSTEH